MKNVKGGEKKRKKPGPVDSSHRSVLLARPLAGSLEKQRTFIGQSAGKHWSVLHKLHPNLG
jgi:hypothetical protein